ELVGSTPGQEEGSTAKLSEPVRDLLLRASLLEVLAVFQDLLPQNLTEAEGVVQPSLHAALLRRQETLPETLLRSPGELETLRGEGRGFLLRLEQFLALLRLQALLLLLQDFLLHLPIRGVSQGQGTS